MNSSKSAASGLITVVLVDDHELVRQGVRKLLSYNATIKIVGEAATSSEAISLISRLEPDVVLLDIRLDQSSGIDVARSVKAITPNTKILVLTAYDDDQYVSAFARIGVSGYLLKTVSVRQLRRAIHDVAEGGLVFPPAISGKVTSLLQNNGREVVFEVSGNVRDSGKFANAAQDNRSLTSRETQVFKHMTYGLRNHEVANVMGIALKTVEAHVQHILLKLGARSRTQTVLSAARGGWLQRIV